MPAHGDTTMATLPLGTFRRLAGLACLVALLSGCEKSIEDAVAEHRPQVETVFGQLRALSDAAAAAPVVTEDRFDLGDARVRLDGDDANPSNALFVFANDLEAPENATDEGNGGTHVSAIVTCGEALRGEFYGSGMGADVFLGACGRAEYAFVLRTNEEVAALVDGTDSFTPGLYDGDVLLFRLSDGALLGGFNVRAESSDEVQVLVDGDGNPIDPTERLNSDISSKVFVAIQDKLRTLVPGAVDAN